MLTLTLGPSDKNRYSIHCRRDDEVLLLSKIDYSSEPARVKVAKQLRIPVELITKWCSTGIGTYTHDETVGISSSITISFHDEGGTKEEATGEPLELLRNVLTNRKSGYLRWSDPQALAVLDCDYHHVGTKPPTKERLSFIMARVTPQPALWWVSRGGGIHAAFIRNNLPADILAAAAGFSYIVQDDTATFEVLSQTRVAPEGAELKFPLPTDDLSALRTFLSGGVSPSDVDDWLEGRGLERNQQYDHTHCPVAGYSVSKGTPVWVSEHGITCHRCSALGITFGSHNAGWFPYSSLCGSRRLNDVALMVKAFTHWSQAEVVLESRCRLKGKIARLVYEGLLKMWHGVEDERVERAFTAGNNIIRGNGRWVTCDKNETLKDIRMTLAGFPATQSAAGKAIPERLEMMQQTCDLESYGYTAVRPIHGMRVHGEFLGGDTGPVTTVVSKNSDPQTAPRYTPTEQRLPLAEAWRRVDAIFPGINHSYLQLLIAARGISEGEVGIPPCILCIGPAATSKSATVHIAASFLGDACTEIDWQINVERFRQGYIEGCDRGSFIAVNEVFKKAQAARQSPRSAFDHFLTLTPDSVSHKLFVGPVQLGRIPVTLATDTSVPAEVRADKQLGRRFVFVRLDRRLNWEPTLLASGVKQPHRFRESSVENAEASNAIVSDIIDRYFRTEPQGLQQIAKDLGFDLLEDCDVPLDDPDSLKNFFEVVCKAPDANDRRLKGRGWKKVAIDEPGETELEEAWRSVCDGDNSTAAFRSSRRCMEVDWSTVVPVPIGTRFEVSGHGKSAAFRFRLGETRGGGDYFVNEQLLTCEGERR